MLPALVTAGKLALKAAPALIGLFGNRKMAAPSVDYKGIVDRYRGMKPTGYLTPEDTKFADTNFAKGAEVVGQQQRGARSRAAGRLAARGLSLSPAAERVNEDLNQNESEALTGLQRNREATLYGLRTNREGREANLNLQGMLAEMSGARSNMEMANAHRAGFFNSILELAPEVFDYFGTPKAKPGAGIAESVVANNMDALDTRGATLSPR